MDSIIDKENGIVKLADDVRVQCRNGAAHVEYIPKTELPLKVNIAVRALRVLQDLLSHASEK